MKLKKLLGGSVQVWGGDERIQAIDRVLPANHQWQFGALKLRALFTPCHTSKSLCYFAELNDERIVFSGDTLFIGGCGRFFEGTAKQMEESLLDVLGALPDDTKVYCGHEYTKSNLLFAQSIEPENQAIQAWLERSRKSPMTIPSTIGEEKLMNPFMRVRDPAMQKRLGVNDSVEAMAKLREMKNQFRAE